MTLAFTTPEADCSNSSTARRRRLQTGGAVLLVLAVAALFRLWHIGTAPPALFGDEAINGMDALDVLTGHGSVFYPTNYGREGLNMLFIAAFFRLLGVTPLAIRLSSVIGGILTTLAVYWLGRELFRSEMRAGKLLTVPLLAALWLATAYWAVSFSRLGLRGAHTVLFGTLTFAAFWRGVNQHQAGPSGGRVQGDNRFRHWSWRTWAWFLLSGLFLGLSLYFYSISRLYPVFLALFLLLQAVVAWRHKPKDRSWTRDSLLGSLFGPIVGLYAVAAAVFAPLGWYFLTHPGSFTQRAAAVSAFGNWPSPWARIGEAVVGNVAQFFLAGHGDTKPVYNLAGRAVMEPVTAILALGGVLICLRRWRRPHYLLLLSWGPIMLLPAFLAVERIPTSFRAMGVMPALYFFPAVAVGTGVDWLRSQRYPARLRHWLAACLLVVPLAVAGAWTARDYMAWAALPATYERFDGDAVEAARWLQANPQQWPVYVSSDLYRHMSFLLLYSQTSTTQFATYRDEAVRWFDGRSALPLPPATSEATYLFCGMAHTDKGWLDHFLPDRQLVYQSLDDTGKPILSVYRARYRDRREIRTNTLPLEGITVTGYSVGGQAQPGSALQVALHWRFARLQLHGKAEYRVQLALLDEQGHVWATVEKNLDYRPQEWDEGSQAVTWYEMGLPGEAPKGAYHLAVRLADDATGTPLGEWSVLAPSAEAEGGPREPLVTFGGMLRLLDVDLRDEAVQGGNDVVAELVLDTTERLPWSYTLFLHVLDADGKRIGQRDSSTGNGLFPTDAWPPDQPLRDVYRISVDAVEARRPYQLALGFYDWRTGERLPALDRDGEHVPEDQFLLEIPSQ
jgi:4-amino-4-deoxy-L-arabinose transferase-like glycosyltransferase